MFKVPAKKSTIRPTLPDVEYFPHFLSDEASQHYFKILYEDLSFKAETYNFYDKEIETLRKMSYHSNLSYSYNNQIYPGKAWHPQLLELKNIVEKAVAESFNAVLVNLYENGDAGMGWHADKEKELGPTPLIASLSLGQERVFAFRARDVENAKTLIKYKLGSGDLILMKGNTQKYFEHCVIKNKKITSPRLNLTFRKIIE